MGSGEDEINESLRFVGSVIFVERVEDGLLALDLVKGIDDREKSYDDTENGGRWSRLQKCCLGMTSKAANHIILYVI